MGWAARAKHKGISSWVGLHGAHAVPPGMARVIICAVCRRRGTLVRDDQGGKRRWVHPECRSKAQEVHAG